LLAITMGDVNGIGPEILAKSLARPEPWAWCQPLVVGSVDALEEARRFAPECPVPIAGDAPVPRVVGVAVCEAGQPTPERRPGELDVEAGRAAAEWIIAATRRCLDGRVAGMVTCPIHKVGFQRAGYDFAGHTDLIAHLCGIQDYRMCLFADEMRIVHNSAHCSLLDAIAAITTPRIVDSVHIADSALRRMGIASPRIAVAGLNPHAGEAGAFGREEIEAIRPAIQACRERGMNCSGPYPPDAVFRLMQRGDFDVVIAMYHDQGHIPLKLIAMDKGVNVTLGIPIVRTSVDHGTAYEIAGKGVADESSLIAAVRLAAQLAGCGVGEHA
jgi:4-hydroxythreonine-4-phosphate dehydrogenase